MAHKEEEDQHEPIDLKIPILTTRRPITGDTAGQAIRRFRLEREISSRIGGGGCVPFSWEKTPGMPKNSNAVNGNSAAADVPSPRPPPNRWCPSRRRHCSKFGRDEEEDVFTDAMDIISLSESFDVACSMNHNSGSSSLNSEALKSAGSLSPNFIIRRFLPDANALACSSLQALQKYGGNEDDSPRRERGRAQRREGSKSFSSYLSTNTGNSTDKESPHHRFKLRSHSPPKACGLDLLSPLIKHSICGLGSPVKRLAPHVKLVIKRQHKHHTKEGDSPFEPKRKKEKLDHGRLVVGSVGRVSHVDGERGSGSDDEASMERFGSRSAPSCSGMNAWAVSSSIPSP